ncbi:MAG: hydrogenase maturation nickel metallochaperone HypA [Planctomycetes bacterium SCN 63-9]|nr:MAG: hydrogenase maturation nickel metallochaperone HypA [Planctomycetes bacterium SCN 63-9]
MHELGIAQEIVSLVSEHASGRTVTSVTLEIGKLSAILPDAIHFCFDLCSEGTELEGAELVIHEIPGKAHCPECGADLSFDRPFGRCDCGNCELEWFAGEELKVKEFEVT